MKMNRWLAPLLLAAVSFVFLREMILYGKIPESADMFHRMLASYCSTQRSSGMLEIKPNGLRICKSMG